MVWLIIIGILLLILVLLLFAPLNLIVNTTNNDYRLYCPGIFSVSAIGDRTEILIMKMRFFFFNYNYYPFGPPEGQKKLKAGKAEKKKRKRSFKRPTLKQARQLIRSFKVKTFWINLDTGDPVRNAKYYPLFAFLNYRYGGFNINFEGRNELALHMQNRPIYILKSFINI